MIMNTIPLEYGLILDMDKAQSSRTVINLRRGDRGAQTVNITLASGGKKIVLPENSAVTVYGVRSDGTSLWADCDILPDGTVSHTFTSEETEFPGDTECELYIVTPESEITSPKFRICVEGIIRNDEAAESSDNFSALGELISSAENMDISMSGKTLSLCSKNGSGAQISFSEKENGKVTVSFSDTDGDESSFDICDGISGCEIVGEISSDADDEQIPTAKAVLDAISESTPVIFTSSVPGSSTAGSVGDILIHKYYGIFYKCTSASEGVYTWEEMTVPDSFVVPYTDVPGIRETVLNDAKAQLAKLHLLKSAAVYPDSTISSGINKPGSILHTPLRVYAAVMKSDSSLYYKDTVIYPAYYYESTGRAPDSNSVSSYYAVEFFAPSDLTVGPISKYTLKYWHSAPGAPVTLSCDNAFASDVYPTENSDNLITSGAVAEALSQKQKSSITDAGDYFTTDTVEGALQEIGAEISGINSLIGSGVIG